MTVHALAMPPPRGACPGLSSPMPTGDGLLVRLLPIGTIPLAAVADLCDAARRHGNSVIEVTSRGSLQFRGLSAASAPQFAAEIAALAIAAQESVPVLCNPLAGLDAQELYDSAALAADLRRALARNQLTTQLGAKVSVAIDGGGPLNLAKLAADIRLSARVLNNGVALAVSVGGDEASAVHLGVVASANAVETVLRLLDVLARYDRDARARDIVGGEGAAVFRSVVADLLISTHPRDGRKMIPQKSVHSIGTHPLGNGVVACGVGFAFGHADAGALQGLADAAGAAGASGLRAAPERTLLAIGLTPEAVPAFVAAAMELGFVGRPDDPRRHVVACAGAPICASAHLASRALAPLIATSVAPYLDGAFTIHVSGCAKGCAQAAPATLTLVGVPGGCALIADGSVRDTAFVIVPDSDLPAAVAKFARDRKPGGEHV